MAAHPRGQLSFTPVRANVDETEFGEPTSHDFSCLDLGSDVVDHVPLQGNVVLGAGSVSQIVYPYTLLATSQWVGCHSMTSRLRVAVCGRGNPIRPGDEGHG